jgi:catechol 2,3-dioxygenase-like lactoylglutathione lyase family enzyme
MKPTFTPGDNIAIKVPAHEYTATVAFYRDVLGLAIVEQREEVFGDSTAFDFGGKCLWIDCVDSISQAEIWLEVGSDNLAEAEQYLAEQQVRRCDAVEELPAGFDGFWIASPSNIVHLVAESTTVS